MTKTEVNRKEIVDKAKQVLDESPVDNIPSVPVLSEMIFVSASALSRNFIKHYGIGINAYSIQRKMEQAQILLEGELPIWEISEMVGYTTVQAFGRTFKNYTGSLPSEFRLGKKLKEAYR